MKQILFILFFLFVIVNADAQDNRYRAGDHEMFFMPTAYTMNSGDYYFTDYELLSLNFTYALTSSTHIGVFSVLPLDNNFMDYAAVGIKQKYLNFPMFKAALTASYIPNVSGYFAGGVFSLGLPSNGFHFALEYAKFKDLEEGNLIIMAGYRFDVSSVVSLMAEYSNIKRFYEEDFGGALTAGVRLKWKSFSIDIAGIRPIADTGSLSVYPFFKATYYIH